MREVAESADSNFVTHACWVQRQLAGMRATDDGGLVIADSGLPCDTFNIICRARLAPQDAPARAREAIDYFARVNRPFSWWVGPADTPRNLGEHLEAAGLKPAEAELAMSADLGALNAEHTAPSGLAIRRASTEAELTDYARINAANWSPPDPMVLRFYQLATPLLLRSDAPLWLYVGYLDGQAVATAELAVGGGVVGLYGIATLEAYRRRGIGTALTLRPLLDARAAGQTTGVLQAAPDGVGIYRRVGFETYGEIVEYKPV